jgi:glutathione S-transferase
VLDDGRTIADSTVIAEYIEEVYPAPPLYPKDPYERSRMRMIEDLCDRSFDAVGFGFWLAVLREQAPESQAMKQAAADELRDLLATLERELGEQNFFCGELSLADFAAICYVPGARTMGVNLGEFPRLQGWMEQMRRMPAVRADHERATKALAETPIVAEFEGADGRIHWRDSRLEWPIWHGFIDLVAREFHAGKMMFPPHAS